MEGTICHDDVGMLKVEIDLVANHECSNKHGDATTGKHAQCAENRRRSVTAEIYDS